MSRKSCSRQGRCAKRKDKAATQSVGQEAGGDVTGVIDRAVSGVLVITGLIEAGGARAGVVDAGVDTFEVLFACFPVREFTLAVGALERFTAVVVVTGVAVGARDSNGAAVALYARCRALFVARAGLAEVQISGPVRFSCITANLVRIPKRLVFLVDSSVGQEAP